MRARPRVLDVAFCDILFLEVISLTEGNARDGHWPMPETIEGLFLVEKRRTL